MLVAGWGFFVLLSLALVLQWINAFVIADEDGVRGRNIFGLTSFQADWSDIDRVEIRTHTRGADAYVIQAGRRTLKLTNYPEADELFHLVRERSPHALVI